MSQTAASPDLHALFRARSVALIGATEKSTWCQILVKGLRTNQYSGHVHLVNPRRGEAFGQTAVASCAAIGVPVDLAIFMVPAAALAAAIADAGAAGIRLGIVLTSGFSELGANGAQAQAQLVAQARAVGVTFLGPNSLGFMNYSDNVPAMVQPPYLPRIPGATAVVSQSGATAGAIAAFAHQQGIGLSYLVALGNEAMIDLADVVNYLIDDPHTRAIALFVESIRRPPTLIEVAARAMRSGKAIVILKVGSSELTAKVAQAHTGALVGDDRVFDAACSQLGIVRVRSIEELVITTHLLAHTGKIAVQGLGVVSISGGACEVIADTADRCGVALPQFAPDTLTPLRGVLSALGASTHNPLDITGAAVGKPEMFRQVLDVVAADPAVGLTAAVFGLRTESDGSMPQLNEKALSAIGSAIAGSGKPGVFLTQTVQPISAADRIALARVNIPLVIGGLRDGTQAIGNAFRWSARLAKPPYQSAAHRPIADTKPSSERTTLEYLSSCGVPVIPAVIATSEEEAIRAARAAGDNPVVLKISSSDIAHKTEAGGVLLDLRGDGAVAEGYGRILANVRRAQPAARLDGVIVSPMRPKGTELLVGIARDPQWGLVMAVALGGIWVEALKDSSLRLLPVNRHDVIEMFGELRAAAILRGYRGQPAVDLGAVADVAVKIAEAALALGPDLASLEVNPLYVGPDGRIECLDALALWADECEASH